MITGGGTVKVGVRVSVEVGTNVYVGVDVCVWVGVGNNVTDVKLTSWVCVSWMDAITVSTISASSMEGG